jgi:hypothetical protein
MAIFYSLTALGEFRPLSEGSQSRQTAEYGHDSRGTRKQVSLCWRGPAAI